ncbi:hypothetical protein K2173_018271 [Erythroxylum novogranatense]|uniref:Bifunctional inhibitor/plant lipid transfer protein/seed storage helical domain-containing protein n=1 Tax=Erythroxylum novogranatense TaxID=1862640 RepID=A0AAV8UDB6_9ROSI|nr:hypothetical protein K2173_018271 [Erythroxylum novogranatense]
MANFRLVFLVVVMVALCEGSSSWALTLCNMTEDGLTACKPSVTTPNPVDPPSADCCQALSTADLTCLCSYRNSMMLPSLGIDPVLAVGLPAKCNLTPPPNC